MSTNRKYICGIGGGVALEILLIVPLVIASFSGGRDIRMMLTLATVLPWLNSHYALLSRAGMDTASGLVRQKLPLTLCILAAAHIVSAIIAVAFGGYPPHYSC